MNKENYYLEKINYYNKKNNNYKINKYNFKLNEIIGGTIHKSKIIIKKNTNSTETYSITHDLYNNNYNDLFKQIFYNIIDSCTDIIDNNLTLFSQLYNNKLYISENTSIFDSKNDYSKIKLSQLVIKNNPSENKENYYKSHYMDELFFIKFKNYNAQLLVPLELVYKFNIYRNKYNKLQSVNDDNKKKYDTTNKNLLEKIKTTIKKELDEIPDTIKKFKDLFNDLLNFLFIDIKKFIIEIYNITSIKNNNNIYIDSTYLSQIIKNLIDKHDTKYNIHKDDTKNNINIQIEFFKYPFNNIKNLNENNLFEIENIYYYSIKYNNKKYHYNIYKFDNKMIISTNNKQNINEHKFEIDKLDCDSLKKNKDFVYITRFNGGCKSLTDNSIEYTTEFDMFKAFPDELKKYRNAFFDNTYNKFCN